eukprot:367587_1
MTSVEQRDLSLNPKEITEISDSNADLSLPMPLSPLISLASLDRCISNPLVRGYSNVSVSSDNEGAHFVPYGRGHDDIANATDLSSFGFNPSFLTDTDGLMQVSPLHVVQSKVMANAAAAAAATLIPVAVPALGPLEDGDTDCTSSQIASSDLPSEGAPLQPQSDALPPTEVQNNNSDTNASNKVSLNAEVAAFVPNPMTMAPPPRLDGIGLALPPLIQAMPLLPVMNPMNLLPLQQLQMNNAQQQMTMGRAPLLGNPMMPTHVHNNSNNNNNNNYDVMVRNYMEVTKKKKNQSNNKNKKKKKELNISNLDITEIIKMNLALPALLQHHMICKFMKHQNGSRYIQERLKMASFELNTLILQHIIFEEKQILSLSEDIFGNYVIQIFFENGSDEHHVLLIENLLRGNAYRLSRSFYGCRVIQKAFDCIPMDECKRLVKELEEEGRGSGNLIHEAIICPNANHVIQKIITLKLDISDIEFIIDCIDENICFYSSHIFGCRIVQNIINYYGYKNDKRMLSEMVSQDNLLHLCQSQYGNYVIQHILALSFDHDDCQDIKRKVVRNVFGNVLYLSKNKYGSNVVERCLQKANDKQRDYLLDQVLSNNILIQMVKHKYANYVVQKLLTFCNTKQQHRLIYQIERTIPNLRTFNYGKHIMDKIKKIKQSKQITYKNY